MIKRNNRWLWILLGRISKKVEYPKNDNKLHSVTNDKPPFSAMASDVSITDVTGLKQRFFTDYDLWDVHQNDSEPCIAASGKDVCEMTRNWVQTIALVNIKRRELWINFWDNVQLIWWPCEWTYSVQDEMNIRFRQNTPVYRPWTSFEIRGDIARFWTKKSCQWAYYISKIESNVK